MTKEQIESMLVDDMVVIICQNPKEKLEAFNLIAENLGVPLGPVAKKSVVRESINYEEYLAVGFIPEGGAFGGSFITSWKPDSTIITKREKIPFDEFAELIRNMGEDVGSMEDTQIEEDFMRLFA